MGVKLGRWHEGGKEAEGVWEYEVCPKSDENDLKKIFFIEHICNYSLSPSK